MDAIFSSLTNGAKFNKKRNAASLELFSKASGLKNNEFVDITVKFEELPI